MNFKNPDYCAVLKHLGSYRVATGDAPDMHEADKPTKLEALLYARQFQIDRDGDPNFVLDLTNAEAKELGAFLR